jgi:hypothetical protein
VICRAANRWAALLAVTALAAACSGSATPATTEPPATSSASTTTSTPTITATTTTLTSTATPPATVTIGPWPHHPVPEVATGWTLLPGDVVVANEEGVHIVRDGVVVGTPVTSPVDTALPDHAGGLVLLAPAPCDQTGCSGDNPLSSSLLWRVTPDGSAQVIYDPRDSDPPGGFLTLYGVAAITPVSAAPCAIFTVEAPSEADPAFYLDRVMLLPLDGTAVPTFVPAQTPGEGGVTGLGWLDTGSRLIMSTASDGGTWLSAWTIDGAPVDWPTNPVPETAHCPANEGFNHCLRSVTVIPGTDLIAYAEDDTPKRGATDLVIFDTTTATEVRRLLVTEPDTFTWTAPLAVSSTTVVVSRMRLAGEDQPEWVYLPVLVYDLDTGILTELPITGKAAPVDQQTS